MYNDIVGLQSFYSSPLGGEIRDRIGRALAAHYPSRSDERVMGLGFVVPWLDEFARRSERCLAMMPARQGAQIWPKPQEVASCLVFEENLPLPDSCLDRIVLVHALEHVENAFETLRELWRVLSAYGDMTIIVTNRHGPWSGADHTPFGNGEPYSRRQLAQLLLTTGFMTHSITEIVHLWPYKHGKIGRFSLPYEKVTRRLFPYFGGLLLAHAQKQMGQAAPARARISRRFFIPAFAPQVISPRKQAISPRKKDAQTLKQACASS